MPSVDNFIRNLDSKVWHSLENIACNHPNSSRLLAFPIAIGTLVRDILIYPAKSLEQIVLTVKSIKAYRAEQNLPLSLWKPDNISNIKIHTALTVGFMLMTCVSPLVGVIDAIVSFVKVGISPFKTAKINAAKQDFNLFLEQSNLFLAYHSSDEKKFAATAWKRFKKQVEMTSNEKIKNLSFFYDETSKRQLIDEIKLKRLQFDNVEKIYSDHSIRLRQIDQHDDWVREFNKLDTAWKKFNKDLIDASPTEVPSLKLTIISNG